MYWATSCAEKGLFLTINTTFGCCCTWDTVEADMPEALSG